MFKKNLAFPVLLISEEIGGVFYTGSGFYYKEDKTVYFVTAKHVLFDRSSVQLNQLPEEIKIPYHLLHKVSYDIKKNTLSFTDVMTSQEKEELLKAVSNNKPYKDAIELLYEKSQQPLLKFINATLYSYRPDLPDNKENEISIQVAKLFKDGKIKYHPSCDLAMIKIADEEISRDFSFLINMDGVTSKNPFNIVWLDKSFLKKFDELLVGNTVFTFGYPTVITKNNPLLDIKLPLLRKGIIAGKNNALNIIILDSPVFYGNSGGLILEVEKIVDGQKYSEKYQAIGIITNFVPLLQRDSINIENSGYSIGVPMDSLIELLNDKK